MPDLDERRAGASPLAIEVLVPRGKLRLQLLEQRECVICGRGLVCRSRALPWRGSAAGRCPRSSAFSGASRAALCLPEVRAGKVPCSLAEDDVGKQPVAPLTGEQRAELVLCAPLVPRGLTHGDAGGVPAPLMWIQLPRRARARAEPVRVEHGECTLRKARVGRQRSRGEVQRGPSCRRRSDGIATRL